VPYPTQPGQVGGHEGVGIVVKLGPGSENGRIKLGDRVGIKASALGEEEKGGWKANSHTVDRVCVRSLLTLLEWKRWCLLRECLLSFSLMPN
jgi:NADPH:quinone reductase-like Zn-dependent oxidoreductase